VIDLYGEGEFPLKANTLLPTANQNSHQARKLMRYPNKVDVKLD
jgi:hypothetical protein